MSKRPAAQRLRGFSDISISGNNRERASALSPTGF
jgi:hypothetical protein